MAIGPLQAPPNDYWTYANDPKAANLFEMHRVRYGLRAGRCRLNRAGTHDHYDVGSTAGDVVVTRLDGIDPQTASLIADIMNAAASAGIKVGVPFAPLPGSTPPAGDPILVKKFLGGICSSNFPTEWLGTAGATLAQIHQIQLPGHLAGALPASTSAAKRYQTGIAELHLSMPKLATKLEHYRERTKRIDQLNNVPWVLLHGDFWTHQLVLPGKRVKREPSAVGVLDWEDTCKGPALHDLGWALVGFSLDRNGNFIPGRGAAFLQGYESIRELSPAEREALPDAVRWAATIIATRRAVRRLSGQNTLRREWEPIADALERADEVISARPTVRDPPAPAPLDQLGRAVF